MRPEGWAEISPNPCDGCEDDNKYLPGDVRHGTRCQRCEQEDEYDIFEAGADAMLEGLKKEGSTLEVDGNAVTFTIPDNKGKNGFLVFIEEE